MAVLLLLFPLVSAKVLGGLQERIVGGKVAPEGEYPFIASLRFMDVHWCGASIIHNRWVLTAAHCVKGDNAKDYELVVGTRLVDNLRKKYQIQRIISHETYNRPGAGDYFNDIALLRTKHNIKFNSKVKPIQVDTTELQREVDVILLGWGSVTFPNEEKPKILHVTKLKLKKLSYCKQKSQYRLSRGDVCTFTKRGQGACGGDSGGPLVRTVGGKYIQVGIASRGLPCASGDPDIFTRVSYYLEWIKKKCHDCLIPKR